MIEPTHAILEGEHTDGKNVMSYFYARNCIDIMRDLHSEGEVFHTVFCDPPFNNGTDYGPSWDDAMAQQGYHDFTRDWIVAAKNILAPRGSLFIHINDKQVAMAKNLADMAGLQLVNWIIWHYRFGQNQRSKLTVSKAHCLWMCHGGDKPNFYPDAIEVESDRSAIYNDWREEATGTRVPFDVWGFEKNWGRVQGNNAERRHQHENQLPECYLERIIDMTTQPGEWVFDPFCGSGTTITVARAMKRHAATCDVSAFYLKSAYERTLKGAVRV